MGTDPHLPNSIILSHYQVAALVSNDVKPVMPLSTDLGLTTMDVQRSTSGWSLPDGRILSHAHLDTILGDQNGCFQLIEGELEKIEVYSPNTDRFYSLMPTPKAPTLLISGIPMHRIKDTTPIEDTRQKLRALGKPRGRVLDTATGLGYTAIQAAQTAELVVTVEFDPAVHGICRLNPWSTDLFARHNIQPLIGDSAELTAVFGDDTFNAIIHDPPTFSLAGQLYSGELYRTFFRILKPGGRLYHYIGNPDSRYGATTGRGVVTRLRRAGFRVTPKEKAFKILGVKE